MKKFLVWALLSITYGISWGQSGVLMDTVQVTAMQMPLTVSETGRSITVLQGEALQNRGVNSIDELLQFVGGVEVQSRGAFGVQADILMRGSTFTQVLVLVNGIRINDALTGHFNGYLPVPIHTIERIEVLRGSASAVYGPDAVGGVINIITKVFECSNTKELHVFGAGGQYGLREFSGAYIRNKGRLAIELGLDNRSAEGPLLEPQALDDVIQLEPYNSSFDIRTFSAGIRYHIKNGWKAALRTATDARDFDARYFYTGSTFDKSYERVNQSFTHFQLSKVGQTASTDINFSYKYNTDEFIFSPDFPSTNNHTTEALMFLANQYRSINDVVTIKYGIQVDRRSIESNDRGNHEDLHFGAYALASIQQGNWSIIPNIRVDQDENYGLQVLPSVNASYSTTNSVTRASLGRSIRAADYTERYVSNNLVDLTPGRSVGNPELAAEQSWTAEIGYDQFIGSNWKMGLTIFGRQSENLIDYVLTNESAIGDISETGSLQSGADYFFANNIASVSTIGLEFLNDWRVFDGDKTDVDWQLGYQFSQNEIADDISSVYLANAAGHLLTNRIRIGTPRVSFDINHLYKNRPERIASAIDTRLAAQYSLFNLGARTQIFKWLHVDFTIHNVLDTNYQNILGAPMPGRWFKFGIGLRRVK